MRPAAAQGRWAAVARGPARLMAAAALSAGLAGMGLGAAAQQAAPYQGLKKTVAVEPFLAAESVGGAVTAEGMTAMLTAALVQDGRFVVVERPGLAAVQAEQTLGQSGAVNLETAARGGQLIGASAIVRAVVTKFQPAAGGSALNVGGLGGFGGLGSMLAGNVEARRETATLEVALRLVDTSTGQVIATSVAQGSASSTTAGVNAVRPNTGLSVALATFQSTPIGKAGEDAIVKAVELIAAGMRNVPWSAQVIDASDGTVYVNAGADRNVQVGAPLSVHRRMKVLTDPTTGAVLDVEWRRLGLVRVTGVRDRVSTAALESGEPPARGDLLRLD